MRRWICPNCESGALAPERPLTDDVRRYCLPCSQRTGRLVKRTCPALDRARAERAEASKAKAAARRARDAERDLARWSHGDTDLRAEAKAIWKHMAEFHRGRSLPRLTIHRGQKWGGQTYCTGHGNREHVHITIGAAAPTSEVLMVLTHELAHAAAPRPGDWHDERWADCYVKAARARWGGANFTGVRAARGYAVDPYVRRGIRAALGS